MPGAINIIVDVERLAKERARVYATDRRRDERVSGWVSFNDFSLYGESAEAFRHIAGLCHEAATAMENAALSDELPPREGLAPDAPTADRLA